MVDEEAQEEIDFWVEHHRNPTSHKEGLCDYCFEEALVRDLGEESLTEYYREVPPLFHTNEIK